LFPTSKAFGAGGSYSYPSGNCRDHMINAIRVGRGTLGAGPI